MNKALLNKEVQDFLRQNYRKEIAKIALSGSPFPEVSSRELAEQLFGKKKAEKKLPTWFRHDGILYPPAINLEQTSSEITARYKASLIQGETLVDITGGFGIDSCFFAEKFQKVIHCELNPVLSEIVNHNSEILGIQNIETRTGDGILFLENTTEDFSWIYIDPSRRDDAGGRVFQLDDCLPNVPQHLDLLFKKASGILIKTSPLLDIQLGIKSLKNIEQVQVIALDNEVKELLWILKREAGREVSIKTINFSKSGEEIFEEKFENNFDSDFSAPQNFLYEPNAAIMKSGLFDAVGHHYEVGKLHPNSHLYTSKVLKDFPGRRFELMEVLPYKGKKTRLSGIAKSNISTRNFPVSVADLRKELKIKEGGDAYLFFTTNLHKKKIILVCRKV